MRLETIWQDIRYAVRGLKQKPGFTIAVVATLGLGIGANAAMFGVMDRALFRPPEFLKDADRVHRVYLVRTFDGKENYGGWFQYTRYTDLTQWTTAFDATAAMTYGEQAVGVGDDAREMLVGSVSASFWRFFDVAPVAGRFFTDAEDKPPVGASVVVISEPFWQTRYGGRSDAIGKRLKIAKVDYEIVGVAPAGLAGTSNQPPVAWVPITTYAGTQFTWNPKDLSNWYTKYNISWMQMMARRKPGVTPQQADADLTSAFKRSYQKQREMSPQSTPAEIAKPRAVAGSILAWRSPEPSETSKIARWVSGVALIVMLIAAANVANLLLGRALRRRREVAVRLALGVSRARLVSQLVTESLVLAALGGVVGLVLAQVGGSVLRTQFITGSERFSVAADPRTLGFAALVVIGVGLLTSLAPALQSGRGDLTTSLKAGSREGTYHRSRTRTALLVLQGALSVILLVGAGLFVRSLDKINSLRMGYDVDRLLWVGVEERDEKLTDAQKTQLRNRLEEVAATVPGVTKASRAVTVPFYMTWDENIVVAGHDTSKLNRESWPIQGAAPNYLATMGTKLIAGRFIDERDTEKSPKIMVVSESMSKYLWPGQNALGQCVRIGSDTMPCTEVVGVAEDIRTSEDLSKDAKLYYYRPITQTQAAGGGLFVRVAGNSDRAVESVRRALQKEMPGSSYVTVQPFERFFGQTIKSWRLGATMFSVFGGLALILAAIGMYSVLAYNVAQRTHELGVRVAFGAQVRDVIQLVLGEGMRLTMAGIAIGGAVALYAGRWVKPLLFNVQPTDPLVFGAVIAVLLLAATMASLIPAIRAARVDPNVALRSD